MRRDAELAEIALAEERRLRLLVVQQRAAAERAAAASSSVPLDQLLAGGDVPPSLAAGRHLQRSDSSTGLPPPPPPPPVTNGVSRPRPDYSNAAGKPPIAAIGCSAAAGVHRALQMQEADTEAFLECLAAMEARVIRATRQAAKATAALRKGGRARGGAGAAAAKAASAEEEAVAAAEAEAVAGLKAQLQVRCAGTTSAQAAPAALCAPPGRSLLHFPPPLWPRLCARHSALTVRRRRPHPWRAPALRTLRAQAALEELRSEQERSALLSQTCESLIRGATTARAPADKSASRRGSTAAAKPAEQGAPQPRRANSQAKVVDREEDTTFGH